MRRRRIIRTTALASAGAVVAVGGFLWLYGMNDRAVEGACGGMLSVADVRAVLGEDRLEVNSRSGNGIATCELSAPGDGRSAKVSIVDTSRIGTRTWFSPPLAGGSAGDMLSVPVGQGWSGLVAAGSDDGEATTTLTLTCGGGSRKTSAGKQVEGLAVTVTTNLGTTLDDPADRPAYVRIATGTAVEAAKAYGCVTRLGHRPVRTVGLPVSEEEFEPLSHTSGTCAGIPAAPGVTTARETARARAPFETCLLGDDGLGNHQYTLQASFGAYASQLKAGYEETHHGSEPTPADAAKGQIREGNAYWGTAACPADHGERAVFLVRRTTAGDAPRPTSAERTYARTILRAFAERSAKAHGCSAPVTP
ncbi:hypothetical protein JK359_23620 [Streptomyces actinomycinicus]|uniref:Uncharacterized protein n=1 Tax=Streptomyces actinomycinicus TaxID=1695166 RepID=A0A937EM12_9ACTN|nr:hypothetical protein [Streptomyces actinomycinicus]MBL1084923.1 hypothetical protein [Streptomyces actinomycinicus]